MKNQKFILSVSLGILGLLMLLSTSVLFYYTFYASYIPTLVKDQSIYFTPESTIINLRDLNLKSDQKYSFSLNLKVSESPHNFKIGNFLVFLEIRNSKNNTIKEITRPGLVKWKSPLLQGINTLTSLSLLLGYTSQYQTVKIQLLENYTPKDSDYYLFMGLSTKELHIQASTLGVKTYLRGLRYFMYEWKVVTGILMVSLILVAEIMGLWGLYLTLKDYYLKHFLQSNTESTGPQRKLKLKKKKSTLSKKSSEETVTARFDSSYSSLHTTTPEEKEINIRNVVYPESPSPWDTYSGSRISLENNDDSEEESSHIMESTSDIKMESLEQDVSKKEVKDVKKDVKEGTSYSFFPTGTCVATSNVIPGTCITSPGEGSSEQTVNASKETRASSYSIPFSTVSLNQDEDISEAVKSWRDELEGGWNDS
jgi:hypothetical protein